jgi:hypothetical protein
MVNTAPAASTSTSAGSRRRISRTVRARIQRRLRAQGVAQQLAAEEEAGQRQEYVDAAGDPAEPDVEHRDHQDRNPAEAVEVVSVEAGPACVVRHREAARGGATSGTGLIADAARGMW